MAHANQYRVELLPNGFWRVFDYATRWDCLYEIQAGKPVYRHGNLPDNAARRAAVAAALEG